MKTLNELKPIIKGTIWELKNDGKVITCLNLIEQANGDLEFEDMPIVLEYLHSIKHSYLFTERLGYLELTPFGKATIKDLVSRA